jgi:tellurite resistance protein, putative
MENNDVRTMTEAEVVSNVGTVNNVQRQSTELAGLNDPEFLQPNYEEQRKQSPAVLSLLREVKMQDSNSLVMFGAKPAEELARVSDEILRSTKDVKNEEASKLLISLTALMKKVNIDDFEKEPPKSTFLRRIFGKVNDVLAKYDTVEKDIGTITEELLVAKTDIEKGVKDLEKIYDSVKNHSTQLQDYIYAIELLENQVREKIENVNTTVNMSDEDKSNELGNLQMYLDQVSQKRYDLLAVRTVSLQTMPMIKMMANNDFKLMNKLHSSLITTLPVFKNAIVIAVNLKRQRVISRTLNSVDEATNELLIKNASNVSRNSVEIAKQANSPAIAVETLKQNFEIIKKGIEDTKAVQLEARTKREANIIELDRLNKEMVKLQAK